MKLFLLPLLTLITGFPIPLEAASEKPNIIFILSDDVGLGDVGCTGGHYKTPNIDALAKGGTRFEYCYANPVCGPSRATCLTGRYVFRTGMLTNGYTNAMHKNEIMLPKVMKPAGYVTAAIGKWDQLPLQPSEWGFDEYLRFEGSGKYWSSQVKTYTQDGSEKEVGDHYIPDLMHEYLVAFMTRHKDQPFYIHYAMSHVHSQILRTPDTEPDSRDYYQDNIIYMDKLVGQLVAALDKLGLREKTLLIFVGDNGTAQKAAPAATVNGRGISGMKGTLLEGGSRVPMIANWPGTTPAGKLNKDLTDFTDFLPTFAALAGAKLPEVKIDGHDFSERIRGRSGSPREWIYMQLAADRYVCNTRWKLMGDGQFFDLRDAPFNEQSVPADTTDPEAKAGRERLQAVLTDLRSQEAAEAAIVKDKTGGKKKKKKKAVEAAKA